MGRFYTTAQPDFIDDFIYQPPWQLMNQIMATKQQGYDDAMQYTELIKDMVDIKHLSFENDRAREIKDYYNAKIDALTSQLAQNPDEYHKLMPSIKNLAREFDTDRKEGNISKIEGRYNAWGQWQKDNEDILKADPRLYNILASDWYRDIEERATPDINAAFAGTKGIAKPDFNSKELREALKEMKANATKTSNGTYIIGNKELTEEEVQNAVLDMYMSNPNATGYLEQMVRLKDPQYYDEETGEVRDLFQLVDTKGNPITSEEAKRLQEEYSELPIEERRNTPFPFSRQLNSQHGFASGIRGWGSILGFQEQDLEVDPLGRDRLQHEYKKAEINLKDRAAMARLIKGKEMDFDKMVEEYSLKEDAARRKFEDDLKMIIVDFGENSPEGLSALKMLDTIYAANTFGKFSSPEITYADNLTKVRAGDTTAIQNESNASEKARGELGYEEGSTEARFLEYMDRRLAEGETDREEIAEEFASQEYVDEYKNNLKQKVGLIDNPNKYGPRNTSTAYMGHEVSEERMMYEEKQKLAKKLNKVAETYDTKKSAFFKNDAKQNVDLHPVTFSANRRLTNTINNNKGSYMLTDKDGKIIQHTLSSDISSVDYVLSSNPLSSIGAQVTTKDAGVKESKAYVIPKSNSKADYHTIRNIVLDGGLQDPKSSLYKEYADAEYLHLIEQIDKAIPLDDYGTKKILYNIPGTKDNIPIHVVNGNYLIVHPNNPKEVVNLGTDAGVLKETIFGR